jgi:hypothetical protein
VLSHGLWQSRYGGAASAVGSAISLNGHSFEVVGVTEPSFSGVALGRRTEVYIPLCAEAVIRGNASALDKPSNWFLVVMGRLKPGVPLATANAQLAAISPAVFDAAVPPNYSAKGQVQFRANKLDAVSAAHGPESGVRIEYSTALLALMGIVALVLVIACANVQPAPRPRDRAAA